MLKGEWESHCRDQFVDDVGVIPGTQSLPFSTSKYNDNPLASKLMIR